MSTPFDLRYPSKDRPFEEFFVATKVNRSLNIQACYPDPPHVLNQKYPNVTLFCFPDRPRPRPGDPPMKALRFTFVLTDETGRRLFGHTLQLLSGNLMCFISKFCWVRFFDEILYQYRVNGEHLESVIKFYNTPVPRSNTTFRYPNTSSLGVEETSSKTSSVSGAATSAAASSSSSSSLTRSASPTGYDNSSIPSLSEGLRRPNDSGNVFSDVRLGKALEFLSNDALLQGLAALMCESRVVVIGRRVAEISDAVLALVALLQPFVWEHVLVPVLPNDLIEVLCSPTPFLIGLLGTQLSKASKLETEEVIAIVLGREGSFGEGSFVQRGIPAALPEIIAELPEGSEERKKFVDKENKLWEEQYMDYGPILTLPFTESSLCSLRVGLFQARRAKSHSAAALLSSSPTAVPPSYRRTAEEESAHDQTLLAAFHDYYVFTFGLAFAQDFTPQNFCLRMIAKGVEQQQLLQEEQEEQQQQQQQNKNSSKNSSPSSSSSGGNGNNNDNNEKSITQEFFERVSNGMMLSELRRKLCENLKTADSSAKEIKRQQLHYHEQAQRALAAASAGADSYVATKYKPSSSHSRSNSSSSHSRSNSLGNNNTMMSSSSSSSSGGGGMIKSVSVTNLSEDAIKKHYPGFSFKATRSDIYHIKYLIDSEFLEAVLERYPLLYPHAAQILAHAAEDEEIQKSTRTVTPLEEASLLRRFASWMSYGVTSTVQKLTTNNKNLSQARAELLDV